VTVVLLSWLTSMEVESLGSTFTIMRFKNSRNFPYAPAIEIH